METEAKILLGRRGLKKVKEKLGSFFCFDYEQKSFIYDLKNGFLRIRNEPGKAVLTFKGKRNLKDKLNCREELNFEFSQHEYDYIPHLKKLVDLLGFKETLSYTKKRVDYTADLYKLNTCQIFLDSLPNGQQYIEIEGSKENIYKNIEALGLKGRPIEKRSYQEILKAWKLENKNG